MTETTGAQRPHAFVAERNLASIAQRLFAKVVDYALPIAFGFAVGFALTPLIARDSAVDSALETLETVSWFIYVLFADALPNGQSLGKRLFRIRVVDAKTLEPCSPQQSCVRNAICTFLSIIELFILAFDERRRRCGDRVAGTLVVRAGPLAPPPITPNLRPVDFAGVQRTLGKIHDRNDGLSGS
jgi:uncharacterized RDD family membrane protein YckC